MMRWMGVGGWVRVADGAKTAMPAPAWYGTVDYSPYCIQTETRAGVWPWHRLTRERAGGGHTLHLED